MNEAVTSEDEGKRLDKNSFSEEIRIESTMLIPDALTSSADDIDDVNGSEATANSHLSIIGNTNDTENVSEEIAAAQVILVSDTAPIIDGNADSSGEVDALTYTQVSDPDVIDHKNNAKSADVDPESIDPMENLSDANECSNNDEKEVSVTSTATNDTSTSIAHEHESLKTLSSCNHSQGIHSAEIIQANEITVGDISNVKNEDLSCASHFVVLTSNGVVNSSQANNENATLSLLDELQLPYHRVDGLDPSHQERRKELLLISGTRANYPQIFLHENNQTRYLGGYDWLKDSIADISGTTQGTALLAAASQKIDSAQSDSSDVCQSKGCVTVLISNGVADYLQAANQKSALQLLVDFRIPHKVIDGMNSSQLDKRNELFKISGVRGNYPQLFAFDKDTDQLRYLGGYDWLDGQTITSLALILE
jgi:glutaredoxin